MSPSLWHTLETATREVVRDGQSRCVWISFLETEVLVAFDSVVQHEGRTYRLPGIKYTASKEQHIAIFGGFAVLQQAINEQHPGFKSHPRVSSMQPL